MTYHRIINQEAESPETAAICQNIAELEKQAAAKGEEVQRINAEVYNPQASVTGQPVPAPAAPVSAAPAAGFSTPSEPAAPVSTAQEAPAAPEESGVASTPQSRRCPNCGAELPASMKFCTECGTKLA